MNPVSNIWAPYPFIRFVFAYIAGIIVFRFFPYQLQADYIFVISGLVIVAASLLWGKYRHYTRFYQRYSIHVGFVALSFLAFAGYSACSLINSINIPAFAEAGDAVVYRAVLDEEPVRRTTVNRAIAKVTHVYKNSEWISSGGKILVSMAADDISDSLHNGSVIIFEKTPEKITNSGNPGTPDFARLWADKFLYYRVYLRSNEYSSAGYERPLFYRYYPDKAASFLASLLSRYIQHKHEKGVALALFLGIKDGIDNELLQSYSAAGAMHVLAVSGMHVAVLFQLFSMLLGRIPFLQKHERFSQAVLLVFIWFYGFITGASASVMRAVVMFSFVVLGKLLHRRSNIYNSISLSAFALLLYNPYLLFDIGFQLSYLAVLGIVYMQPRLEKYWSPEGTIIGYFADIVKVSVAAQLATFPLSIYYFQQFPTYFLLSNLFIIPVSSGAMYAGIFLLFTYWITPLAIVSGYVTEYLLMLMNYAVSLTEILPMAVISGIKINALQCICMYLLLVMPAALFTAKKIKYAWWITAISLVFSVLTFSTATEEEETLLFYNTPKIFMMEHARGNSARVYIRSAVSDAAIADKVLPASHTNRGITHFAKIPLLDSGSVVINVNGNKVVLLSGNSLVHIPDSCSVLVINTAFSENFIEKIHSISYKKLLISSAFSATERAKWKRKLLENNIRFTDISEGAIFLNLKSL